MGELKCLDFFFRLVINVLFFFFLDAKLGKKCTLLDLSQRLIVAEPETQVAALLSSVTKDQDSCSTPKTPTDRATSGENLETNKRTEKEETKEEAGKKGKSEELSAEESPEKMEVDRGDSPSNEEQSMTKFT